MLSNEQFTGLAQKYIDTVFRVALNCLRSPSDADDVTQNVFLKLFRETREFESEEHIKHWLIRVTINECRSFSRSPWRKNEPLEDYEGKLAMEQSGHSDLFYAVMELPTRYRVPIYLHYYEGYSTEEIGGILKIPKSTVCSQLKRGREMLRKTLTEV